MATYNTIIEQAKTRPCWVNGRRALFHRWTDSARPAKARGEENDPEAKYFQLYSVHALVEYEDGTMARVWPAVLQFAPSADFAEYDWEGMEEKRDALPYTYDEFTGTETEADTPLTPNDCIKITPHPKKHCLNCGAVPVRTGCGFNCGGCTVDGCRCRDCKDASLWVPEVGNGWRP